MHLHPVWGSRVLARGAAEPILERSMKHEICKIAEVPAERSLVAPFFGRELHVHRAGGTAPAVANVCLHFGGPLDCRDGALVRPWRGATFDMEPGERRNGPAPAGSRLMVLSTRVEGDALLYVWGE
jgi:nitrite reductase/ring-hydroxylating ferredoxin subunit